MTSTRPPHLQRFVRDQLASGRFQSESALINAALHLLEEQSPSHETSGTGHKQEIDQRLFTKPSEPATKQSRSGHRERLRADHNTQATPVMRRSPRGILADLRSDLSFEDIQEARSEVWSTFPRGPSC